MDQIYTWIASNWETITGIIGVILVLLNMVSKHFSNYTWLVKAVLFISEMLSFFVSKDVKGIFKFPLTSKAPGKVDDKTKIDMGKLPTSCILAIALSLGACGAWQTSTRITLDITGSSLEATSDSVHFHYAAKCKAIAIDCNRTGNKSCGDLVNCYSVQKEIFNIINKIQIGRIAGYNAIRIGNKELAESLMSKGLMLVNDLTKILKMEGVI